MKMLSIGLAWRALTTLVLAALARGGNYGRVSLFDNRRKPGV
jgi:hypothetical protein